MKKTFAIAFSFLYLAFNVGLGLSVHYCGDRVSSVELSFMDPSCCCGTEKEMPGCCSEETVLLQTETEHHASAAFQMAEIPAVHVDWAIDWDQSSPSQDFEKPVFEGPPDLAGPPIFLQLSKLILYG